MRAYAFHLVLVCLVNDVRGASLNRQETPSALDLFKEFIKDYGRVYENEIEFNKRFQIFSANLETIKTLQETKRGTAEFGITKFADWSHQEFDDMIGYEMAEKQVNVVGKMAEVPYIEGKIPVSYDWRDRKMVTPIRDQGKGNFSWAFSVVSAIESSIAINRSALVNLSVQQFVDCCIKCDLEGGLMYSFLGGVQTENTYPFVGKQGQCKSNPMKFVTRINGFHEVTHSDGNEKVMAEYLYRTGPLLAAVNAKNWRSYKGGIYHPTESDCSSKKTNHGVLIVGYGVEKCRDNKSIPYWIIKNSWGKDWGEKGYMRLYRGNGSCGINKKAYVVYVYKRRK